jgi:hypothetical protein
LCRLLHYCCSGHDGDAIPITGGLRDLAGGLHRPTTAATPTTVTAATAALSFVERDAINDHFGTGGDHGRMPTNANTSTTSVVGLRAVPQTRQPQFSTTPPPFTVVKANVTEPDSPLPLPPATGAQRKLEELRRLQQATRQQLLAYCGQSSTPFGPPVETHLSVLPPRYFCCETVAAVGQVNARRKVRPCACEVCMCLRARVCC